ncbi:MAG: phosphate signaling complex protein PhoU [Chloroflexota bacterium]
MRTHFDRELNAVKDELVLMGSMVNQALRNSVTILKKQDQIGANRLIAEDDPINIKRYKIEKDALMLITLQQPVASDLRQIAAFLEISGELERIGDYAKGIAVITLYIGHQPLVKPLVDIPKMAQLAADMLQEAINTFVHNDETSAREIATRDDKVDEIYKQVHEDLIALMAEDSDHVDQINYLLWVAHNLERAADRVVNICERVVFTVTGDYVELDGPEIDKTKVL